MPAIVGREKVGEISGLSIGAERTVGPPRSTLLGSCQGVTNISPPHFWRVCKSIRCNNLRRSAQLLSQAGVNLLESIGYGGYWTTELAGNFTANVGILHVSARLRQR